MRTKCVRFFLGTKMDYRIFVPETKTFIDMCYIYYLFSLCLGLSLLACGDDADDPADTPTAGAIIVDHFYVAFEDEAGQDLIGSGVFSRDSLEICYVVDGEIVPGDDTKVDLVTHDEVSDNENLEAGRTYLRVRIDTDACNMPPYFDPSDYDTPLEPVGDDGELYIIYGNETYLFGPIHFGIETWHTEMGLDNRIIKNLSYEDQTIEGTNGVILVTVP